MKILILLGDTLYIDFIIAPKAHIPFHTTTKNEHAWDRMVIEMSHFVSSFGFEPGRGRGFLSIEIAQNMVGAAQKVGHTHCNRLDGLL